MGHGSPAPPLPTLSRQQIVSLSQPSCVSPVELTVRRRGDGVGEEPNHTITRQRQPGPQYIIHPTSYISGPSYLCSVVSTRVSQPGPYLIPLPTIYPFISTFPMVMYLGLYFHHSRNHAPLSISTSSAGKMPIRTDKLAFGLCGSTPHMLSFSMCV